MFVSIIRVQWTLVFTELFCPRGLKWRRSDHKASWDVCDDFCSAAETSIHLSKFCEEPDYFLRLTRWNDYHSLSVKPKPWRVVMWHGTDERTVADHTCHSHDEYGNGVFPLIACEQRFIIMSGTAPKAAAHSSGFLRFNRPTAVSRGNCIVSRLYLRGASSLFDAFSVFVVMSLSVAAVSLVKSVTVSFVNLFSFVFTVLQVYRHSYVASYSIYNIQTRWVSLSSSLKKMIKIDYFTSIPGVHVWHWSSEVEGYCPGFDHSL